jgi:hypothetical protein
MIYQVWTDCDRPDHPPGSLRRIMSSTHDEAEAIHRRDHWACGGFCGRRHEIVVIDLKKSSES